MKQFSSIYMPRWVGPNHMISVIFILSNIAKCLRFLQSFKSNNMDRYILIASNT